jgi:hypothetical protein
MELRRFEVRWAGEIGRALLPPGLLGGAVDSLDLGAALYRECLGHPWYSALIVRISLWLTWFSPLFRLGRIKTFGGLDGGTREKLLEALLASPIYVVRATLFYFKLTACLVLLDDEAVLRRIGAYEHGRASLDAGRDAPGAREALP